MSRLRPICRFVSPLADSRSTSRILRTDNLSAAIPSPGSKSAGKDGLRGEGVQRRRRQPAWSTSTETAGQLAPKRVVRFDRNGWSAWSETSGQIGAKYAPEVEIAVIQSAGRMPDLGPKKVAATLNDEGVKISASGVRWVLKRHGLHRAEYRRQAIREGRLGEL